MAQQAAADRHPCVVHFPDETFTTILVTPDTTAARVCAIVSRKRQLTFDDYDFFALSVVRAWSKDRGETLALPLASKERALDGDELVLRLPELVGKGGTLSCALAEQMKLKEITFVFRSSMKPGKKRLVDETPSVTRDVSVSKTGERDRAPTSCLRGYMYKRGVRNRAWKLRWFLQVGNKLHYFKDKEEKTALGTIDLEDAYAKESPASVLGRQLKIHAPPSVTNNTAVRQAVAAGELVAQGLNQSRGKAVIVDEESGDFVLPNTLSKSTSAGHARAVSASSLQRQPSMSNVGTPAARIRRKHRRFGYFQIITPTRVFHLKCQARSDMYVWIAEISKHSSIKADNDALDDVQAMVSGMEFAVAEAEEDANSGIDSLAGVLQQQKSREALFAWAERFHCDEALHFWWEAEQYRLGTNEPVPRPTVDREPAIDMFGGKAFSSKHGSMASSASGYASKKNSMFAGASSLGSSFGGAKSRLLKSSRSPDLGALSKVTEVEPTELDLSAITDPELQRNAETAKDIFDKYLAEGAPRQLPMDRQQRAQVMNMIGTGDLDRSCLRDLQERTLVDFEIDQFPRFVQSNSYRLLLMAYQVSQARLDQNPFATYDPERYKQNLGFPEHVFPEFVFGVDHVQRFRAVPTIQRESVVQEVLPLEATALDSAEDLTALSVAASNDDLPSTMRQDSSTQPIRGNLSGTLVRGFDPANIAGSDSDSDTERSSSRSSGVRKSEILKVPAHVARSGSQPDLSAVQMIRHSTEASQTRRIRDDGVPATRGAHRRESLLRHKRWGSDEELKTTAPIAKSPMIAEEPDSPPPPPPPPPSTHTHMPQGWSREEESSASEEDPDSAPPSPPPAPPDDDSFTYHPTSFLSAASSSSYKGHSLIDTTSALSRLQERTKKRDASPPPPPPTRIQARPEAERFISRPVFRHGASISGAYAQMHDGYLMPNGVQARWGGSSGVQPAAGASAGITTRSTRGTLGETQQAPQKKRIM